jgi:hypothetical protein
MRLSPLEAYDTVMRFARDCGEWPLRLAMHASVAQSFRPLFLHLTKLNYLPEAAGDPSVESDVLLAPFCREIGAGYFDFDPRVRALLLDNLQSEYAAEGRSRLRSVAGFLMSYLDAQERSIDSTQDRLSQSYIEVQRWIALSILDPDGAAQQLAAALNRTGRSGAAVARVQIGGLVNALAAPLLRYPHLTDYALGVQALERGEVERAQDLLSGLGDLQVGPVKLRPARAVLAAWNVPEKAVATEATQPRQQQSEYASCFISWARGEDTRQFVDHLARDLRYEGVDCQADGEDLSAPLSPLAGRQVLVLVNSARADSTWELSQHADEAAKAGNPIVTISLDRQREIPFSGTFDAVGEVDFSYGRTPYESGYRIALNQLLELLRDQAGWRPKAPKNPWVGKKFKNDVFISYRHEHGWEEQFHRDLEYRLRQVRHVKTTIWKDTTAITMGDSWSDAKQENVRDSAIFLPLVTPRYLDSEICSQELVEFVKSARESGGLSFESRHRILPVFMGLRQSHDLPYPLREVQGITFPEPGNSEYYVAINELANTLSETLKLFQTAQQKTVHLANATGDIEPIREEVRRELQSHGYGVTESDLEGSSLSIHLIGDEYREAAVAQFDMVRKSGYQGMPILVWIKPGTAKDPNQREWIESIERGDYPTEILRTSVQDLKAHILDILRRRDETPHPPAPSREHGVHSAQRKVANVEVTLTVDRPDGLRRIGFTLKKDTQDDGSIQWQIGFQITERGKKSDPFGDPIVDLLVEVDGKLNGRAQAMAEKGMTSAQSAFACGPAADTAKDPNVSEAKKQETIQAILTR